MKIYKLLLAVASACCLQAAQAGVIIDNTFANGNGSFEFDGAGTVITDAATADGVVGKWGTGTVTLGAQEYRVDRTRTTDQVASFGNSLQINAPGPLVEYSGGIQNTGYALEANSDLTLTFDWQHVEAKLGLHQAQVALFTSSDNTLSGSLTELGSFIIGAGIGNQSSPKQETLAVGTIPAAAVGQELFIVFAHESYTGSANFQRVQIDNVSLVDAIPEPATLGMVAAFGGGILFIRRRFMM